jgi:hypothetical protein
MEDEVTMTHDARLTHSPNRALLLLGCIAASAFPAVLLTLAFAQQGELLSLLPPFWGGILLGPLSERVLYIGRLETIWLLVALTCLPLMLAHPLRPNWGTAALTVVGFTVWYAAAFLIISNWEAPV